MFRQRTKLAHRVAAPQGTNASPAQNAAPIAQHPGAPTPPTFYNPSAVGAPPAPSPGPSVQQQGWQQSPQQPAPPQQTASTQQPPLPQQQQQQWYPPQQQQASPKYPQQQVQSPTQNNNNTGQEWWNNWDQQQAQWEPVEQQQQPNQQWNQQQSYQAYDSQNNYNYDYNYQPGDPSQAYQNQAQQSYPGQQQSYPQQPQQNDTWNWGWNQGNQDTSWNWEDKDLAAAQAQEAATHQKMEQLEKQLADVNLNEIGEVRESAPPPPPPQMHQTPRQSPQVHHQTPVQQPQPPPPEPEPSLQEVTLPEALSAVDNLEVPEQPHQGPQEQFSANLEVEPDNEESPQDAVMPPPAASPLPPPPPVSSRMAVGQDDPSPWPSVIPPPENLDQQRPHPSQSTSPPLPPPPTNENVDPVSASDRNQFLETGQLSAELSNLRTVTGESRQSPVPGGPRVVPGTTEPDEPNGQRSETIGSECDEPAPPAIRTTGEGVGQPPPIAAPPSIARTSAEGDNESPPRPIPKKQPMRPTEGRTNAEGTNAEPRRPPPQIPAASRAVLVGEQNSAFKDVSRRGAEGEATPERDPAPESELEEGEISDLEIISGGEFEHDEQEAEEEAAQEKRKDSRQPTPQSPPQSPPLDKKERRRRERERKESDERRSEKKVDKSKGKPPRPGKEEPKKRSERDRESQPRSRRRKDYEDYEEEDSDSNHSDRGRRYRGERSPDRKHSSYRSGRHKDYYRDRDRDRERERDGVREKDDYRSHRDYRYEDDRYSNRERSRPPSRAGSEARRNDYESDHLDRGRVRSSRDKAYYDYRDRYRRDTRDPYYGRGGYDYYGRPYDSHHQHYPRGPPSLQLQFPEYNLQTAAYYEELRRTNPAAYAEWYRRYISMPPSSQQGPGSGTIDGFNDDNSRGSVHSGRSSINDEIRFLRARSPAHSLRDLPLTPLYLRQGPPSLPPSYNPYYPQQTLLNSTPSQAGASGANAIERQPSPAPIQRLTPAKFTSAHPVAKISGQGRLVHVLPHYPREGQVATVLVHDLQTLLAHDPINSELRSFPGPLVKGTTHKNSVIQFCSQKIRNAQMDPEMLDRDSYILLWRLLILLLRQNGTVVGADIAELLLEDSDLTRSPHDSSRSDSSDSEDESRAPRSQSRLSENQLTAKFRQFLLFGNTKEALDWAMKHGLWGHALFLASKMDARTYASVMTRFANGLSLNDPLQTLYQLMSGRQPAAVTSVSDEKWGDWKPHLAMMLSNPSSRSDLDHRAITTLGDTLAARGCLYASQFCYLLSQLDFGTFGQHPSPKLCLLATSAALPLDSFATIEAIQCTEVYEYARRLAEPSYYVTSLQPFKLLYAGHLIDYGYSTEALLYCEELANTLVMHNSAGPLAAQVAELADKLKQSDPLFSPTQEGEEVTFYSSDPEWLSSLRHLAIQNVEQYEDYSSHPQQSQQTDQQPTPDETAYQEQWQQYYYQQSQWQQQQQNQADNTVTTETTAIASETMTQQNNYWQQQPWSATEESQKAPTSETPVHQQTTPQHMTPQMSVPQTPEPIANSTPQHSYNYWDQSNQQSEQPEPNISLVPSRRQQTLSESSSESNKPAASKTPTTPLKKPQQALNPGQEGSGWLGGLLSKISLRPKNQMKLPDDKNPSIVWDADKNKWVNKDGDGAEVGGDLPPPPKMNPRMQPSASSTPVSSPVPNSNNNTSLSAPPAGGSGYKLGRNMRKNYVNVLQQNGSAASSPSAAPTDLFPGMGGPKAQPPVNLFVPAPVEGAASSEFLTPASSPMTSPNSDSENSVQQAGPVMYNPVQFGAQQYQ
ncbi:protein transport protein Sec16A isoform X2 [Neocloeon triangulifer]|uniref:protein transport protein Sec16A isoform X2 n=1 Tax=Neocloeon triangulifer TaxID=2078957 RepID=UPI00286F450A|nr:protein transport protein Sec16A isoform X2 [Neocloeon triangulifer]